MKRRFTAFLLAMCLAFGLLPMAAAASDEQVDVTFSVLNGTWADGESSIVVPFSYGQILEAADIPVEMEPFPNFGGGYWMRNPIGTEITEEITFLYNFQPLRTVTFDACGGTFENGEIDSSIELVSGMTCGSLPDEPVLEGCFFMGWFTGENGFGSPFTTETVVEEDLTVYAKWEELVNITCDGNSGKWTIQEEDENGEPVFTDLDTWEILVPANLGWGEFLPEEPLREGFLFEGWSQAPNGEALTENTVFSEDAVVFARWQQLFTLCFDGNGPGVEALPGSQEDISNTFTVPDGYPNRPGHDFLGWNTQSDGSGDWVGEGETITISEEEGSVILYAIWQQQNFTITFDGLSEVHCLWGETLESLPELEPPEGEKCRFSGWETDDGILFDPDTPITENLTLYSRWTDLVEITFRIVNGLWVQNGQETYTITVDKNSDLTEHLPTPQPDPDCKESGSWDAAPSSAVSEIFTYTCHLLDFYQVTFYVDGLEWDAIQAPEGRSIDTLPIPSKSDHEFSGWYTAETDGEKCESVPYITKSFSLYARWSQKFVLCYDANADGDQVEGLPADQEALGEGDTFEFTISDSHPTRFGYTFLGWEDENGLPAEGSCIVAGSRTLYARWQRDPSTFCLYYNANGGENAPPAHIQQACTPSYTFITSDQMPARKGYLFRGWAWDPDAEEPDLQRNMPCTITGEATLYAVWEAAPQSVTVFFLLGDTEYYQIELSPGQALSLPEDPSRQGYVFSGWNTSRDGTGANVNEQTVISKNLVVYGVFIPIPQITVDFYDRDVHLSQILILQGTAAGEQFFSDPHREKYLFTCWNTSPDGSGQIVTRDSVLQEDTILYAVWQKQTHASACFVDRGHQVASVRLELGAQLGENLPLPPEWDDHQFLGWNTQENGTGKKAVKSTNIYEDTTYYAQWAEIRFANVTFLDRGAAVSEAPLEPGAQLGQFLPRDPVWEGHRFLGWNSREDGTGKKAMKSMTVREDTTFYAQWEQIEYVTVTFMDRGREVSNLTLELGRKPGEDMPANPIRSGYTFRGWNLEPEGSGKKLYKTTSVTEDVTVYAQWTSKASPSGRSSNPRTGDPIFAALGVLVFSGLALAALPLVRRKKR